LELSIKNRITIYDAIYVSLSEMLNFGFITADERLHNALKDKANIRLIQSLSSD
jgi:predicted nucleic acid-binding protein